MSEKAEFISITLKSMIELIPSDLDSTPLQRMYRDAYTKPKEELDKFMVGISYVCMVSYAHQKDMCELYFQRYREYRNKFIYSL